MANLRICSIPGCGKPHDSRGYCGSHYSRYRRHGDPLAGRTSQGEPRRFFDEVAMTWNSNECLIWPFSKNKFGYAKFHIDGRTTGVCTYLCTVTHGASPSPDYETAHSCGNGGKGCCNRWHLEWKTHAANIADKIAHGTHQIGVKHGMARLTEDDVREIRRLRGVFTLEQLAQRYGVTFSNISCIQRRATWRHID